MRQATGSRLYAVSLAWMASIALLATEAGAEAQTPAQPPPTTVDASEGGVTISSGVNSLTIGARVQFRWTVDWREQADADTVGLGVGVEDPAINSFDVPRLRVTMSGGVYREWLRYLFQFEYSRTSGAGNSKIKDAIIEIRPPGQPFRVQFGQFKVPFGLQRLTSSGKLEFVDRAITDVKFTPDREMGAMLSGAASASRFGYAVGVFNGSGESNPQDNAAVLVAGRFFVDPLGPYVLSEGPGGVAGGGSPILHLGAAVHTGKPIRGRAPSGVIQDVDGQTALSGEFAFRTTRFYSTAEYFWETSEQANPAGAPDLDSMGYHAQVGFLIVAPTTEIAGRYALVEGDTAVPDSAVREIRAVFNHYFRGHSLKVQSDIGQIHYDAGYASLPARARQGLPGLGSRLVSGVPLDDYQFRLQFQVAF